MISHDGAWTQPRWRSEVRRRLLKWFEAHARSLPWRSKPTPYRVWVSEVMLQQTQVSTVLPYFERFMRELPDVAALARVDEDRLLQLWEGLGYYRRARSMHAAAKRILAEHDGVFPTEFDQVLALPGIGRYTAGAVLSISGDQRLPILEGNTLRVFSRWIGLRAAPTEPAANRMLWGFAEAMLPRRGSGAFNQAAMELGALVCAPRSPACERCPVAARCETARHGLQAQIPAPRNKINYESRTEFAFIVTGGSGTGCLVRPIPKGRRWEGLWDFPRTAEQPLKTLTQAAEWLSTAEGLSVVPGKHLLTLKHAVTRYRITLHVHAGRLAAGNSAPQDWEFVPLHELAGRAMNASGRHVVQHLETQLSSARLKRLDVLLQ